MNSANLYSIRDEDAGQFAPPFVAVNDAVASRQYARLMHENAPIGTFNLYILGTYDYTTGVINACVPTCIDVPMEKIVEMVKSRFPKAQEIKN